MIDDGLVSLDHELGALQDGVKETKTAKLPVGLNANANEEGLLFGGGHDLGFGILLPRRRETIEVAGCRAPRSGVHAGW
jgi:hypothetical protein